MQLRVTALILFLGFLSGCAVVPRTSERAAQIQSFRMAEFRRPQGSHLLERAAAPQQSFRRALAWRNTAGHTPS